MPNFRMEIYNVASGVQYEYQWRDAQEFEIARAFLDDLLGPDARSSQPDPDEPLFYYMKNETQRDAWFQFSGELRRQRPPEP